MRVSIIMNLIELVSEYWVCSLAFLGEQNYFGYGIFVTLCVSFKYDVYWKVDGGYIKQKKNLGKKGQ